MRFQTAGTRSNRPGIGARVRIHTSRGWQWQTVKSASGYCSQSEGVLTFGLGSDRAADTVEVYWPSGQREVLKNVAAGRTYTLKEGSGIVSSKAYAQAPASAPGTQSSRRRSPA